MGEEKGERQALIQNMAKRLSMHGKLLLSEVPIYRINTLHNCFCIPSPSPHPCRIPSQVGLELRSPREVPLLRGMGGWRSRLHPHLRLREEGGGSEILGLLPPSWAPRDGAEACA